MALGLLAFLPLWLGLEAAQSAAFHFMAIGQLFFAYAARHTHLLPLPNPYLHGAVALGILLQVLVGTLAPGLLEAQPLAPWVWFLILLMALLAWGMAEAVDRVVWRKEGR